MCFFCETLFLLYFARVLHNSLFFCIECSVALSICCTSHATGAVEVFPPRHHFFPSHESCTLPSLPILGNWRMVFFTRAAEEKTT